jgi:hypothetical protein
MVTLNEWEAWSVRMNFFRVAAESASHPVD